HTKAGKSGQHMLGGRAQRTVVISEHGGKFGCGHCAHVGADLAIRAARQPGAQKNNAGAGVGRMKCESDRRSGVNAYSGNRRFVAKRGLLARLHAPTPVETSRPQQPSSGLTAVVKFAPIFRPMASVAISPLSREPPRHPASSSPSEKPVSDANLNRIVALHQLTL